MSYRKEKIETLLTQQSAAFFNDRADKGVLMTVTRSEVSSDGRYATIYLTVYPDEKMENTIKKARRKRGELNEFLKGTTRLKHIPFLHIEPDNGEKRRQRIDELSLKI